MKGFKTKKIVAIFLCVCFIVSTVLAPTGVEFQIKAAENKIADTTLYADNWIRVEDSDSSIQYKGEWRRQEEGGHSGGSANITCLSGAEASFTFTGTGIKWMGQRDTNFSRDVKIYIDGAYAANVSANSENFEVGYQKEIFSLVNLPNKEHVITIKSQGPGNSAWNQDVIELDCLEYTTGTEAAEAAELYVASTAVDLKPTETVQLMPFGKISAGKFLSLTDVNYESADTEIASVNGSGLIMANKVGSTSITITSGGKTVTVLVSINKEEESETVQVDDSDSSITYTGSGWTTVKNAAYIGGSQHQCRTAGDSAELSFTGIGVKVIGSRKGNANLFEIYIDGTYITVGDSFDQGNPNKVELFSITGLANKQHTLKIVSTGNYTWLDAMEYETKESSVEPTTIEMQSYLAMSYDTETAKGETKLLTAIPYLESGSGKKYVADKTLTFTSFDPTIVSVDDTGTLTSKRVGETKVTVGIEGSLITKDVTVYVEEKSDSMRHLIDNEHPLFFHHLTRQTHPGVLQDNLGVIQGGHTITSFWKGLQETLSEELMPYQAIFIHAGDSINDSDAQRTENKRYYEEQAKIAQANHIPFILMISNSYNHFPFEEDWMTYMYHTYSYMIGVGYSENHASADLQSHRGYRGYEMAQNLETASIYGAYVFFADTNNYNQYMETALNNKILMSALEKYQDHFVLMPKYTSQWSQNGYNAYQSVAMGGWYAHMAGNWGSLIDSWMWWDLKYANDAFRTDIVQRAGGEECKAPFSFPELNYPIRMISEGMSGATVWSFEHPYLAAGVAQPADKPIAQGGEPTSLFTPNFTNGIKKAMEYLTKPGAIPTRAEVESRTKVVYDASKGTVDEAANKGINLIKALYGDENLNGKGSRADDREMLMMQLTGRYGIIPILPKLTSEESKQAMREDGKQVLDYNSVISQFNTGTIPEKNKKVKDYFDQYYTENPSTYDGVDTQYGFVQHTGDVWFTYNNIWNANPLERKLEQRATLKNTKFGTDIDVTYDAYTYYLMEESEDSMNIHFNNYFVDKSDVWDNYNPDDKWDGDNNRKFETYLLSSYIPKDRTRDDTFRSSTITFKGLEKKPIVTNFSGLDGQYDGIKEKWNETTGEYTLVLSANGYLDFTVTTNYKEVPANSIQVSKDTLEVGVNLTSQLEAVVGPENATNKIPLWFSDNEAVATVDENGVVKGIASGSAVITAATENGLTDSCIVKVTYIPVEKIVLPFESKNLTIADVTEISCETIPSIVSNETILYSTSDSSVVKISETGKIEAVGVGSALITVSSVDGPKGYAMINVNYVPYVKLDREGMTASTDSAYQGTIEGPASNVLDGLLNTIWHTNYQPVEPLPHHLDVNFGKECTISMYEYTPRAATNGTPGNGTVTRYELYKMDLDGEYTEKIAEGTWNENDEIKKVVFETPIITQGIRLTVLAGKGGFGTAAEINFYESVAAPSARTIADKITGVMVQEGEKVLLLPELNGFSFAIKSTDNHDIIGLDGSVHPAKEDITVKVVLTVTDTSNASTADTREISVLVEGTGETITIPVEGVTVSPTEQTLTIKGEQLQLTKTISPTNATNPNVSWVSDKPSVATVDTAGKVTAVANGTAKITVTTADGKKTAIATITVDIPIVTPTIEPTTTPKPTIEPTTTPRPTIEPTVTPKPTIEPTTTPRPTIEPTTTPRPTIEPTVTPKPTIEPTVTPKPTIEPTTTPKPTIEPTTTPEPVPSPNPNPEPSQPDSTTPIAKPEEPVEDGKGGTITSTEKEDKESGTKVNTSLTKDANGNIIEVVTKADAATKVTMTDKTAEISASVSMDAIKETIRDAIQKAGISKEAIKDPIGVEIYLLKKDVVDSIKETAVDKIQVNVALPEKEIEGIQTKVTKIEAEKDIFVAAKAQKKDVTIVVKDSTGKEQFTWTFAGSTLAASKNKIDNLNLSMEVLPVKEVRDAYKVMTTSSNKSQGMVFRFHQEGTLPAQAGVKIYVGDQTGMTSGKKVTLYYYNEKAKKLEELFGNSYTVDKDGSISVKIEHCSDYVLVPSTESKTVVIGLLDKVAVAKTTTVKKGANKTLLVKNVGSGTVAYVSSNKGVAVVSSKGKITGKKVGTAVITTKVTMNGKSKTFKTTVKVTK